MITSKKIFKKNIINKGSKKDIPKIYIFDFDDTLVTNHEVDLKSFNMVLKNNGLNLLTKEKLTALRKKGLLAEKIFMNSLKNLSSKSCLKLINERKELLKKKEIWHNLKLNPGVKKTLSIINNSSRGKIIILTRKNKTLVKYLIEFLGILDFIDQIVTTENKGDFIKKKLKKEKNHEIIFVSDSEDDILDVKELKIKTFCFYNKYKDVKKMNKLAEVIYSLDQIFKD